MSLQDEIIEFYQRFDKYKIHSKSQLLCHIEKSFNLNQYKIERVDNHIVSFTNWAFMSEKHEEHYRKTGQMLFNFWDSGDKCWVIDSITEENNFKNVLSWGKKYFAGELGLEYISWFRVSNDCRVKKCSVKYKKEEWLNG